MNIALLLADEIDDDLKFKYGNLYDMYKNFFQAKVNIEKFEINNNKFPEKNCYDAYVISGSRHTVHDDLKWVNNLKNFVRDSYRLRRKVIGICFGHQVIADALGGKVEALKFGWNFGVKSLSMKALTPWMIPKTSELNLVFNHRYYVNQLPVESEVLAADGEIIQMYTVNNNFLGLQAHPEYSIEYQEKLMEKIVKLNSCAKLNYINKELIQKRFDKSVSYMRDWIYNFITF